MKTMTAKYAGRCGRCGGAIGVGQTIEFFGRGRATHAFCNAGFQPSAEPTVHKCWDCKESDGTMRNMGAATPVLCDYCYAKRNERDNGRGGGSVYTRFAGGGESYRNARGRCEDAPCCGCCS